MKKLIILFAILSLFCACKKNQIVNDVKDISTENQIVNDVKDISTENQIVNDVKDISTENQIVNDVKDISTENKIATSFEIINVDYVRHISIENQSVTISFENIYVVQDGHKINAFDVTDLIPVNKQILYAEGWIQATLKDDDSTTIKSFKIPQVTHQAGFDVGFQTFSWDILCQEYTSVDQGNTRKTVYLTTNDTKTVTEDTRINGRLTIYYE